MILTTVCVVAILAIAYLAHRRVEGAIREMRGQTARSIEQMRAETTDREAALNKQAKVFVRKLEASRRAAMKTVDESRAAVDEARTLNLQTHEFFRDRRVQRFLDDEGEVSRGRQH